MKKVKITLKKSLIGRPLVQRRTVQALGLKKMQSSVEHVVTPQIHGMIQAVNHLINVEYIQE